MEYNTLFAWILLGLFAGALAKFLMPGEQKGGCLLTMVLGLVGSLIGGWIGHASGLLSTAGPGSGLPSWGSIITATVGAFLLLLVFRLVSKR